MYRTTQSVKRDFFKLGLHPVIPCGATVEMVYYNITDLICAVRYAGNVYTVYKNILEPVS